MNRNMTVPDKVYSLFKMGSASTDQSGDEPDGSMSLLRNKSPYSTPMVPPSLIPDTCITEQ